MNLQRIYDIVIRRDVRLQGTFAKRLFATQSEESKNEVVDITSADEKPIYSDADNIQIQEEIARKRNKSRLNIEHRNILMGLRPYDKPHEWYHNTIRYKKRMLGRYGLNSIDKPAGFAWPTPEEVKDAQEYEKVAFPLSLQERWEKQEEESQAKAIAIKERENEILEKLAKMGQWTAELNAKIARKEAEQEKARLRKNRLVEEVRRHFGFKISLQDQRFKDMLAQKEKEEKKKKKEAKKKEKIEKLKAYQEKLANASEEQKTDSTKSID